MRLLFASAFAICLLSSSLSASIVFTKEAPTVQSTTVAGTITETFNSLAVGTTGPSFSSPIGTYSGGIIVAPNTFGGANQTNYISVGAQSGTTSYSIDFGSLKTYFGFFWQAADFGNSVAFYNGSTLQGNFAVGDISSGLPSAYYGNPNTGADPNEAFVYLNFTATDLDSRFDRVVFTNSNLLTGFETDNHSTYDQIITPPGVPEPSTYALMASGIAGVIGFARRRKQQKLV